MRLSGKMGSLLLVGAFANTGLSATPSTLPSMPSTQQAVAHHRAMLEANYNLIQQNEADRLALTPAGVLSDPKKRDEVAPKVIALLNARTKLLIERKHLTPRGIDRRESENIRALLYLFKDADTVAEVDRMASGEDAAKAEVVKLQAGWIAAAGDVARQQEIAALADSAASRFPKDNELTLCIAKLAGTSADLNIRNALLKTCTQTMSSSMSREIIEEQEKSKAFVSMQEAAEKQKAFVDKPMTIAGPNVNGGTFTSADWHGKVVLVDFWATWCGPCKAELPRVKAIYDQYHSQGFEIIGVSSDESAAPLKKFVAESKLPWPQLFDAEAAQKGEQSALMKQFNIASLPTMFLIDRNGVCRSVTARHELETLIADRLHARLHDAFLEFRSNQV